MLKNIQQKSLTFFIGLIFLFPILKENIASLIIILLCVFVLTSKNRVKHTRFLQPKTFFLTVPFYIILINTLIFSGFKSTYSHAQHALLFIAIPMIFNIIPIENFNKKKINLYFNIIKNVCLLIAIIYVISYLYNVPSWQFNVVFNNESRFRNHIYNDFNLFVIHPSYYTTILIFCAAQSFDLVLREKKYLQLIYVVVFLAITLMLLTKLNLVLMVAELTLMIFIRSFYQIKTKLILVFSMISLICTFAFFTPGIKERFIEIYKSFGVKPANAAYDSTNVRKAIFDSSINIIKDNWITGVGFDNLQDELNKKYKENYDSSFFKEHNYMTHNYYFYILISSGIFGFLFYLYYLATIIKICLKSNIFLFKLFVINALIICFVEDYFYRQYGALFFNLVLMCFIIHQETIDNEIVSIN